MVFTTAARYICYIRKSIFSSSVTLTKQIQKNHDQKLFSL